jgi:YD repeat-containing protein
LLPAGKRIINLFTYALAVLWVACPISAAAQSGQEIADAAGFKMNRDYVSELPFEHVDTLSGNLILTFTDLVLPGNAGRSLRLTRTFNNKNERSGPKWTFGIAGAVMEIADTTGPVYGYPQLVNNFAPRLFGADGSETPTAFLDPLDWSTPTTIYNTSRWAITAQFARYDRYDHKLYTADGTVYEYEVAYTDSNPGSTFDIVHLRLVNIYDPFGNRIELWYNAGGLAWIAQYFDQEFRGIGFDYDNGNPLPRHMYYDSQTWTYDYDPGFRAPLLSDVTLPTGPGWSFAYNGLDEVTSVTTPTGGIVSYDYANHQFGYLQNALDETVVTSRVLTSRATSGHEINAGTWSYGYTENPSYGTRMSVTSPTGTIVHFDHDASSLAFAPSLSDPWHVAHRTVVKGGAEIEKETRSYTDLPVGMSAAHVVSYVPVQTSSVIERGGETYTTAFSFHTTNFADYHRPWKATETGQLTRTTTRAFTYAFNGLPGRSSEPFILGAVASEVIAVNGQEFTTSQQYSASTGFVTETSKYGITTSYAPDSFGNVASESHSHDGSVHTTHFTYAWGVRKDATPPISGTAITRGINGNGTIAWEKQGNRTTTYSYDELRRRTRVHRDEGDDTVTAHAPDGKSVTVTRGVTSDRTDLNGFGQPLLVKNAMNVATQTTYDEEGRVSSVSAPFETTHPEGKRMTSNSYDGLGRLTQQSLPGGKTITYSYTGMDVEVKDENGHRTTQRRKAFGDPAGSSWLTELQDANGGTWHYGYDALGTLTSVTAPDLRATTARTWTYSASKHLLTSETHPESGTTSYAYDSAGRLSSKMDANNVTLTFEYDGNDRVTQIKKNGTRVKAFTYETGSDLRSRIQGAQVDSSFTYDLGARLTRREDTVDGKVFTTRYDYDDVDNVDEVTYPTGRVVKYGYDHASRITSIEDVTVAGQPKPYASNMNYHPSGGLSLYTSGNNVVTTLDYDPDRMWLSEIRANVSDGVTALDGQTQKDFWLKYTRDGVGNVTNIQDLGRPGYVPSFDEHFQYDTIDRVTHAENHGGDVNYTYDWHGNQSVSTGTPRVFDVDTLRLMQDVNGAYTYDNAGQLSTWASRQFSYDPNGMITRTVLSDRIIDYQYDGDDQRTFSDETITATAARTRSYFIHGLGSQLLSEFTQRGTQAVEPTRDYIYAGTRLIASARPLTANVGFSIVADSVSEAAGSGAHATLKLRLPQGAQLATPLTVTYTIGGSAYAGGDPAIGRNDFTPPSTAPHRVIFAAGSGNDATVTIPLAVLDDPADEDDETVVLTITDLSGGTGSNVRIGANAMFVLAIEDNDPPPVVRLSSSISVPETQTSPSLTVTLSAKSGRVVTVNWSATGMQRACVTYPATGGVLTFNPGDTVKTIALTMQNDNWTTQPTQAFTVTLTAAQNGTLDDAAKTSMVTITSEDGHVFIDTNMPGRYLADVRGTGTDYVTLANPSATAVSATVTVISGDGSRFRMTREVPAWGRNTIHLHNNPELYCVPAVSMAVQYPAEGPALTVEHAGYFGQAGGRATEGVAASPTWYFAEGGPFGTELMTVFNPNNFPVTVTMRFHTETGLFPTVLTGTISALSRFQWKLNDHVKVGQATVDHGTVVSAVDMGGVPAKIAANRTVWSVPHVYQWMTGDDAHSSSGVPVPDKKAYLAEGLSGAGLRTYLTLVNLSNTTATFNIEYLHELGGPPLPDPITVLPYARRTVEPPPPPGSPPPTGVVMPGGGFGYRVTSTADFVAERTSYVSSFNAGSSGTAVSAGSRVRSFAEGATGGFETWFLLMNPSDTTDATVSMEFYSDLGVRLGRKQLTVPAKSRTQVGANGLPNMRAQMFQTIVWSSSPIVTERVSYWTTNGVTTLATLLMPFDASAAAALLNAPAPSTAVTVPSFDSLVVSSPPAGPAWAAVNSITNQTSYWAAAAALPRSGSHVSGGQDVAAAYRAPTVAFTTASATVAESIGSAPFPIRLTTDGAALTSSVTLTFTVTPGSAPAASDADWAGTQGTVTFQPGDTNGTIRPALVDIVPDRIGEPNEKFLLTMSDITAGGLFGPQQTLEVTIADDDPTGIAIGTAPLVAESAAVPAPQAVFPVTLTNPSTQTVMVNWATVPGADNPGIAQPGTDYIAASGTLTFLPGETAKTISITIVNNDLAEKRETFTVRLSSPSNAPISNADGIGTIDDDEVRVEIDPSLLSYYFADLNTQTDTSGYLAIFNPNGASTNVRLIFTRPNGSGVSRVISLTPFQRRTIDLGAEPGIQFGGDVSAVVQAMDSQYPIVAEASSYWQADMRGGRTSRGVTGPGPSAIRYFSEGATGNFEEFITVFNPSNQPANVTLQLYLPSGLGSAYTYRVNEGPGRIKIRINDLLPGGDHSFAVIGKTLAGADLPLVFERTMYWDGAARTEGHSSMGLVAPAYAGYLAEGLYGYSSYLAILNPGPTTTTLQLRYLHESGAVYTETKTVAPYSRNTFTPSPSITWGTYSTEITTTNNVPFVAERSLYTGPNWKVLDSSVANETVAQHWTFAEGATGYFHSYLLLGNPSNTAASVSVTFRLEGSSTPVTTTTTVPAHGRTTIDLNGVPGLSNAAFAMEVTSTVAIVADRTMYWPANGTGWNAMHIARGRAW